MWRLTQIGWLWLAVLGAFGAAALTSQSGLLLLLAGILLGCFLVNLLHARRSLRQVRVEPPALVHLAEGGTLGEAWLVGNEGRQAVGQIEVSGRLGVLLRIGRLAGGASVRLIPTLTLARRGVYPLGEISLGSAAPFGLVRGERLARLAGEIVVYPAVYETPAPPAAGYDQMVGGRHRGLRRVASGTHFAGVRPFQPGDPFKQIHWQSSAKGLGLMVKSYDEELSGRVAVIIDPGAGGDLATANDAVRAAGSLMFAALDEGHHVEWLELGASAACLVPPFDDGHDLLDALARLRFAPDCAVGAALRGVAGKVSPRSAIALVLTAVGPEVGDWVAETVGRGRCVSVYLPVALTNPPEFPGVSVFTYAAGRIAARA